MFSDIERAIVRHQVYKDAALAVTKGLGEVNSVCIKSDGSVVKCSSLFYSVPEAIGLALKRKLDVVDKFVLFYSQVSNQSSIDNQTVVLINKNGFDEDSSNRDALVNVTTNSVRIERIFGYSIWVEKFYFRSYFFMRQDRLSNRPIVAVGMLDSSEHVCDANVVSLAAKVLSINPFD